jgi:riboflavin biosynthesis pyrimidine reductase
MRRLFPEPGPPGAEIDLAGAYAYPAGRPWVRANMVASVDGAAVSAGGSEALSGPADKRLLGVLRALADVVLVGAGTVRAVGYRPLRARRAYADRRAAAGQSPAAALAVVTERLDLDPTGALFSGPPPTAPTLLFTCGAAPVDRRAVLSRRAEVVVAGDDRVDLGRVVDLLAGRGWGRVLCEGGPRLLAELTAAGRLDELCLTVSPLLVAGGAPRILAGEPLAAPSRLRLVSLLEEEGFLFARYLTGSAATPA